MSKDTLIPLSSSSALQAARTQQRAAASAVVDVEAARGPNDAEEAKRHEHPRWQYVRSLVWLRAVLTLIALYAAGLAVLYVLFTRLPSLETLAAKLQATEGAAAQATALRLALPKNFDELRLVKRTLELYRRQYAAQVATLLVASYWFLQAFMIPGSIAINILVGSMYPFWWAMGFTAVMATIGATSNYLLATWLLKDIVTGLFPARVQGYSQELKKHQAHLLNYMLFLRVTPLLPAWFINLASPCVGVPLHTFVIATAVGHQPINFITVQAGESIGSMTSFHDLYSPQNVLFLLAVGSLALIPVAIKRRHKQPGAVQGPASAAAAKAPFLGIKRSTSSAAVKPAASNPLLPLASVSLPSGAVGGKANGVNGIHIT